MSGARETGNRRYRYNRPEEEDGYKTMRLEEFKEDLKKDKRLKEDTVTSYLSIASDAVWPVCFIAEGQVP